MPRAFIHIGLPKTGTTSLQVALASSREAMAAEGFLYPASAINWRGTAHHQLAREIMGPTGENRGAGEALLAELAGAGDVKAAVISTEGLSNAVAGPRIKALLKFIRQVRALGYSPCVVVSFRHLTAFTESMFLQSLWTGNLREDWADYRESTEEWFHRIFEGLDHLRSDPAVEDLKVIDLGRGGRDSISAFAAAIGLPDHALTRPGASENTRVGLKEASLIHALLFDREGGRRDIAPTKWFVRIRNKFSPLFENDRYGYRLFTRGEGNLRLARLAQAAPAWLRDALADSLAPEQEAFKPEILRLSNIPNAELLDALTHKTPGSPMDLKPLIRDLIARASAPAA